ncbi:P-loop containing nucleoside triphosphate hydrolase protein [Lineolata rhizophorae]|uniref:P-loop containing nucleoside triphosphate hydrolase protein n=1 Tax=Lineolata rhizophorae TaxID=578093 RepID=A0A6A6P7A4_9PEZI|nr:P-loop containing nucleoside triphosphate hydrolase protein [Lineolata rhizophorae]
MNRWKKWDLNDDDLSVIGSGTIDGHEQYDNFTPDHDFDALQARLCPTTVSCYGMTSRRWYVITVESISEAKWANEAIEHLVLDESTKKIVLGLVQQHQKNKDRVLSDVIPSKGKGLVFVLHGPPGVGKTLTAESVAEYTQKPLFPMNIGEMVAENDLTSVLQDVFITATRWDAVLVLDEADVLLEKRSFEDLGRNGVVSVFLRMIEYYEGILFLTTNRIETMDIAFQSRIHIAIEFKALDSLVRRQIWENFIHRLDVGEAGAKKELLAALDDLQEWDLNGRQIRNVLSIAQSIALSSERRRGALRYEHVEHVASQTINFQHFFEGSTRDRKAQIGEISSRQFQERRGRGFR